MFNWLREFREVWNEPKPCTSCDILKLELGKERLEKQRLLNRLLTPEIAPVEHNEAPEPQPIPTRHIPWKVRQQALEEADREKAQILSEFRKRDEAARKVANSVARIITPSTTVEELERTLGIVEEK